MKPRPPSRPKQHAFGNTSEVTFEEPIVNLGFDKTILSGRRRPDDSRKRMYYSCFSEFGCEILGVLYSVPELIQKVPGMYATVMGWHGREYLYRHLADEFWELKPDHMWLREYCRAFHHTSKNLSRLEETLHLKEGIVVDHRYMGQSTYLTRCNTCQNGWIDQTGSDCCKICKGNDLHHSLFGNIAEAKKRARRLPPPSREKIEYAATLIGRRSVGVFARGRKTYGRNLPPEFYVKLIRLLEERGYTPIWLGEEATTLPCPVPHILEFSRMPESRDLETTIAIVKQCEFTIQFWTASSRLAGLAGVPYLLVESPSQIWDGTLINSPGQEGYRLELCSFGPKKIVASNYQNFYDDQEAGLEAVRGAIGDMEVHDYRDVLGPLADRGVALAMRKNFYQKTRLPEEPWKN